MPSIGNPDFSVGGHTDCKTRGGRLSAPQQSAIERIDQFLGSELVSEILEPLRQDPYT